MLWLRLAWNFIGPDIHNIGPEGDCPQFIWPAGDYAKVDADNHYQFHILPTIIVLLRLLL